MSNKKGRKIKSEEIIQTSFLVPIREDVNVGDGQNNLHSDELLELLCSLLENLFGGQTRAQDLYEGSWVDPISGKPIKDISRKYFVDVKLKKLNKMKDFMKVVGIMFKQKCIHFECGGKVEYIYSHERWEK